MVRLCIGAAVLLGAIGCEVSGRVGAAIPGDDATSSSGDVSIESAGDASSSEAPQRDASESSGDDVIDDATSGSASGGSEPDDADASSSDDATTGAGTLNVDCCAAYDEPGCFDASIESCVCALDPYCCDHQWDEACVAQAGSECGGPCGEPESLVPGDCCEANTEGNAGCYDTATQDCVCAVDPYCCLATWDALCVELVDEHACGACV